MSATPVKQTSILLTDHTSTTSLSSTPITATPPPASFTSARTAWSPSAAAVAVNTGTGSPSQRVSVASVYSIHSLDQQHQQHQQEEEGQGDQSRGRASTALGVAIQGWAEGDEESSSTASETALNDRDPGSAALEALSGLLSASQTPVHELQPTPRDIAQASAQLSTPRSAHGSRVGDIDEAAASGDSSTPNDSMRRVMPSMMAQSASPTTTMSPSGGGDSNNNSNGNGNSSSGADGTSHANPLAGKSLPFNAVAEVGNSGAGTESPRATALQHEGESAEDIVEAELDEAGRAARQAHPFSSQRATDESLRSKDSFRVVTNAVVREVDEFYECSFPDIVARETREKLRLAQQEKKACSKFVLLPQSNFRRWWDVGIIVLVLYNAVALPLDVGFQVQNTVGWVIWDYMIDLTFAIDLVLNFRTARIQKTGMLDITAKGMACAYLRGWFAVDFMSTFPFELILRPLLREDSAGLNYLGLVKCLRLLRMGRIMRYLENFPFANLWRVVRLMVFFVLCVHWFGCFWYLVGAAESSAGRISWIDESDLAGHDLSTRYIAAVYSSLCMLVGENMDPRSPTERSFAVLVILYGACMNATLFGQVALLLSNQNSSHNHFQQSLDTVNQNMRILKLPEGLQQRVRHYYDYWFHRHRLLDYKGFMSMLSSALGSEVCLFLHREMVQKVPLFRHCNADFLVGLVKALTHRIYMPGDFIVRYGEYGHEMYFINNGVVDIIAKNGVSVVAQLTAGDYFGELALLSREKRTATARARGYCDMSVLRRTDLDNLLNEYPEMEPALKAVAQKRVKQWKDSLRAANRAAKVARKLLARTRRRLASRKDSDVGAGGGGGDKRGGRHFSVSFRSRRSPSPTNPNASKASKRRPAPITAISEEDGAASLPAAARDETADGGDEEEEEGGSETKEGVTAATATTPGATGGAGAGAGAGADADVARLVQDATPPSPSTPLPPLKREVASPRESLRLQEANAAGKEWAEVASVLDEIDQSIGHSPTPASATAAVPARVSTDGAGTRSRATRKVVLAPSATQGGIALTGTRSRPRMVRHSATDRAAAAQMAVTTFDMSRPVQLDDPHGGRGGIGGGSTPEPFLDDDGASSVTTDGTGLSRSSSFHWLAEGAGQGASADVSAITRAIERLETSLTAQIKVLHDDMTACTDKLEQRITALERRR